MQSRQRMDLIWVLLLIGLSILFAVMTRVPGQSFQWTTGLPAGIALLLYALFYLDLSVDARGVRFALSPFYRRTYAWADIEEATVLPYRPILDFGGWGWRYSFNKKAWAFTVSGSQALRLTLKDGKTIYIGITDEDEARQALQNYRPKLERA